LDERPDRRKRQKNPGKRESVFAAKAKDRHHDCDERDQGECDDSRTEKKRLPILRKIAQRLGRAKREHQMEERKPAKAPPE